MMPVVPLPLLIVAGLLAYRVPLLISRIRAEQRAANAQREAIRESIAQQMRMFWEANGNG